MNPVLEKLQKDTGVKMGKFDNERIYNACKLSIVMLENIWKDIESLGLKNEQVVLDWLDQINAISIRN